MKKIILVLLVINFSYAQQSKRKLVWEENFLRATLNEKLNFELGNGCLTVVGATTTSVYTK
jgi:hypothetical protein